MVADRWQSWLCDAERPHLPASHHGHHRSGRGQDVTSRLLPPPATAPAHSLAFTGTGPVDDAFGILGALLVLLGVFMFFFGATYEERCSGWSGCEIGRLPSPPP